MNLVEKLAALDNESPKRIVVIGDTIEDVYVYGFMSDSQDGCKKFVEDTRVNVPGGAANAYRSLAHWCSGSNGMLFVQRKNVSVKTRFMIGNKCLWRHDLDYVCTDQSAHRAVFDYLDANRPDAVLICDYTKGMLTVPFLKRIIGWCSDCWVPCVADVKQPPHHYTGAILKCNDVYQKQYNKELSRMVYDANCGDAHSLVVTGGELTPLVWDRGLLKTGSPFFPPVQCVNHVGAGDCFAAHLTLALAHEFSLKEAATVAHCAGRVYVRCGENTPPRLSDMINDLQSAVNQSSFVAQ